MNPYSSDSPKLLDSAVCFIDILGFSQLSNEALSNDFGNEFLIRINNALSNAYENIRKKAKDWNGEISFSIKAFTDNIVIGYPLRRFELDCGEPEIGRIFNILSVYQVNLALEGFLTRGGIAVGKHYMNKDIVYGDALLEAVKQDKTGGPPCVSLSKSATDLIKKHMSFYTNADSAPHSYDLLEDSDGTIYINYLQEAFIGFPDAGIFFEIFEGHRKTLVSGLEKYQNNQTIKSKYEWAARYHNYVCEEMVSKYSNYYIGEDTDPLDALAVQDALKLEKYIIDGFVKSSIFRKFTL